MNIDIKKLIKDSKLALRLYKKDQSPDAVLKMESALKNWVELSGEIFADWEEW